MNPDDLLAQISEMVQQYMEAGGDPAALDEALASATGGAEEAPPEGNLADALGGLGGAPGPEEMTMPPVGGGGDPFKAATAAASADIGAAQEEAGVSSGIPDEFSKKKRTKA